MKTKKRKTCIVRTFVRVIIGDKYDGFCRRNRFKIFAFAF